MPLEDLLLTRVIDLLVCVRAQLCSTLCDPMDSSPPVSSLFHFPGKNTGVGCPAPRDPPDPGIEPVSLSYPALETEFFTTLPPGKPNWPP